MSELRTTDVPGWVHSSIQGEVLHDAEVPRSKQLSSDSIPVVVAPEVGELFQPSNTELTLLSRAHGRSFEVGPSLQSRLMGRVAVWNDEFGNNFAGLSLKGNNFQSPEVYQSPTAPSGYIIKGLLESDSLLRAIRSSRLLREAGVATEWIHRVFEPQELIYRDERVSPDEYKRRILDEAMKQYGPTEMAAIATAIQPMSFYITGRSMEINDRIQDILPNHGDQNEFSLTARLKHVFRVYNATHQNDKDFAPLKIGDGKKVLDEKSVDLFFSCLLPELIGENLAKLHNLGLTHKFLHPGNITLLGGIVDLDSVNGEGIQLGDEAKTPQKVLEDLVQIFGTETNDRLDSIYQYLIKIGILTDKSVPKIAQETAHSQYAKFRTLDESPESLRESIVIQAALERSINAPDLLETFRKMSDEDQSAFIAKIHREIRRELDLDNTEEALYIKGSILIDHVIKMYLKKFLEGGDYHAENGVLDVKDMLQQLLPLVPSSSSAESISQLANRLIDDKEGVVRKYLETISVNEFIQVRLLRGLILELADEKRVSLSDDQKKLRSERIKKVIEDFTQDFNERVGEIEHVPYARTIDNFYCIDGTQESDVVVSQGKPIHSYDGLSFKRLVNAARKANMEIMLRELPEGLAASTGRKEDQPRSVFTDAEAMTLKMLEPSRDYANPYAFFTTRHSYVAWLYEPVNPGERPILEIDHVDTTRALAYILKSGPVDVA